MATDGGGLAFGVMVIRIVLCGSVSCATGVIWASSQKALAMSTNRISLVKDSLELLRQVREEMANNSNHSWVVAVDEAIVRLELYLHEGVDDPGRIADILKVLARGLGAILALQRLCDRDQ